MLTLRTGFRETKNTVGYHGDSKVKITRTIVDENDEY